MDGASFLGRRRSRRDTRRALAIVLAIGLSSALPVSRSWTDSAGATSRAWSIVDSPNPSGSTTAELSGVACPLTTSCFAVGNFSSDPGGTDLQATAAWWNGSWSLMSVPTPVNATGTVLTDVSCPGAASCFAVGNRSTTSALNTLVEHWNGTSWDIEASPRPSTATAAVLSDVSCPDLQSCFAVGYHDEDFGARALTERFDGTKWALVRSARPADASDVVLDAVSCQNRKSCYAVGYYSSDVAVKTLVERWNGRRWAVMTSRNPAHADFSVLSGISCPSSTTCVAVGYRSTAAGDAPLAERWDGKAWHLMTTPQPAHSSFGVLNDVSCRGRAACIAVGDYSSGSTTWTLADHWDGKAWRLMTVPSPAEATVSVLAGVSCPGVATCVAIGSDTVGGVTGTLAEGYG